MKKEIIFSKLYADSIRDIVSYFNFTFDLVAKLLNFFGYKVPKYPSLKVLEITDQTLDGRIAKIDEARTNLLEGLTAIDELRQSAIDNKKELDAALERLALIESQKLSIEAELAEMRKIAASDISVFRKLAGIPTEQEKFKDKITGFVTGVLTSLIATAILALFSLLF